MQIILIVVQKLEILKELRLHLRRRFVTRAGTQDMEEFFRVHRLREIGLSLTTSRS
jgi:hypothetical protein